MMSSSPSAYRSRTLPEYTSSTRAPQVTSTEAASDSDRSRRAPEQRQDDLDASTRQGYPDGMAAPRHPTPGAARLETVCCSFCSKDKETVTKLVAGPGVYICNECVW